MMKAYPVIVYHFPNSALGGIVMAKILITNPAHDDITHYLHVWSRQTIARAESGGHKVLKIERENVNRKNIEKFGHVPKRVDIVPPIVILAFMHIFLRPP